MTRAQRQSYDHAYKLLFSHRELVIDLITGYVDPAQVSGVDLTTLERCNGSFIAPDVRERRSDVIWRARLDQQWIYLYLLLEFQSTVDRFMMVRVLAYIALLWQDLLTQKPWSSGGIVPPVLPIVLYNGESPWSAATDLQAMLPGVHPLLTPFQPQARYLVLDEQRLSTSKELGLRNLAAAVFALEQSRSIKTHRRIIRQLRSWLQHQSSLDVAFATWYHETMRPTDLISKPKGTTLSLAEVDSMMATRIMKHIERRIAKGRAKGKAEGKAMGLLELLATWVHSGKITVDDARLEIQRLLASGSVSPSQARTFLDHLG